MQENISQEATSLKKLDKQTVRYTELEQFKKTDHHTGYFCYNCIYFMKPSSCAIVSSQGVDFNGNSSGIMAHTEYVQFGSLMKKRFISARLIHLDWDQYVLN